MSADSRSSVEVMIATPVEEELTRRIREVDGRVRLLYEPELLPPPRYPSDHKGESGFRRDERGEQLWEEMIGRAEVLFGVPGESPEGLRDTIERGSSLRWIQATNAGAVQHFRDSGMSPEILRRVAITTASGVHATPLAEFCMFGILAFAKDLPWLLQVNSERSWYRCPMQELSGLTLLVVGMGSVGGEVARLAACFGMGVIGIRRHPNGHNLPHGEVYPQERLREVLPRADAVVVTLPLTEETQHLLDREAISLMKPGAIFVNVGRGGVVDEEALRESLEEGRLSGAVLDVFQQEPLPSESHFWSLPNVLVSPHTAALSESENERIVELFSDNLRRYLDGEPLVNRIHRDSLY